MHIKFEVTEEDIKVNKEAENFYNNDNMDYDIYVNEKYDSLVEIFLINLGLLGQEADREVEVEEGKSIIPEHIEDFPKIILNMEYDVLHNLPVFYYTVPE